MKIRKINDFIFIGLPKCPDFICFVAKVWKNINKKNADLLRFTLIELLIVIAIIAILLTILLPALKSVKDKTKRLACLNNEKQLGIVLSTYANDYNSCLPTVTNQGSYQLSEGPSIVGGGVIQNLGVLVPDYLSVGGAVIFFCPSKFMEIYSYQNCLYPFISTTPGSCFPDRKTCMSYFYRCRNLAASTGNNFPQAGLHLTDKPGTAVLADWAFKYGTDWRINHLTGDAGTCQGFNVLYLDGHAKWFTMGYTELSAIEPRYYLNYVGTINWFEAINEN